MRYQDKVNRKLVEKSKLAAKLSGDKKEKVLSTIRNIVIEEESEDDWIDDSEVSNEYVKKEEPSVSFVKKATVEDHKKEAAFVKPIETEKSVPIKFSPKKPDAKEEKIPPRKETKTLDVSFSDDTVFRFKNDRSLMLNSPYKQILNGSEDIYVRKADVPKKESVAKKDFGAEIRDESAVKEVEELKKYVAKLNNQIAEITAKNMYYKKELEMNEFIINNHEEEVKAIRAKMIVDYDRVLEENGKLLGELISLKDKADENQKYEKRIAEHLMQKEESDALIVATMRRNKELNEKIDSLEDALEKLSLENEEKKRFILTSMTKYHQTKRTVSPPKERIPSTNVETQTEVFKTCARDFAVNVEMNTAVLSVQKLETTVVAGKSVTFAEDDSDNEPIVLTKKDLKLTVEKLETLAKLEEKSELSKKEEDKKPELKEAVKKEEYMTEEKCCNEKLVEEVKAIMEEKKNENRAEEELIQADWKAIMERAEKQKGGYLFPQLADKSGKEVIIVVNGSVSSGFRKLPDTRVKGYKQTITLAKTTLGLVLEDALVSEHGVVVSMPDGNCACYAFLLMTGVWEVKPYTEVDVLKASANIDEFEVWMHRQSFGISHIYVVMSYKRYVENLLKYGSRLVGDNGFYIDRNSSLQGYHDQVRYDSRKGFVQVLGSNISNDLINVMAEHGLSCETKPVENSTKLFQHGGHLNIRRLVNAMHSKTWNEVLNQTKNTRTSLRIVDVGSKFTHLIGMFSRAGVECDMPEVTHDIVCYRPKDTPYNKNYYDQNIENYNLLLSRKSVFVLDVQGKMIGFRFHNIRDNLFVAGDSTDNDIVVMTDAHYYNAFNHLKGLKIMSGLEFPLASGKFRINQEATVTITG